jgi:hypothetical protein
MDAMTTERPTIGHNAGHMTDAEYERERERIRATYGGNKQQAGARYEQELSRLFALSGWGQADLAKKEGYSVPHVSNLLRFGQFLTFLENSANANFPIIGISEPRFRGYWSRTDTKGQNYHIRFREVARLMAEEWEEGPKWGQQRKPPLSKAVGQSIAKKCPKGKWLSPDAIATKAGCTTDEVHRVMDTMDKPMGCHGAHAERKKVGTDWHYRIFKQDRLVAVDELVTKLTPIIEALEAEGKKSAVTTIPAEVRMLAVKLKRILNEWAE